MNQDFRRYRLHLSGRVQGVGFRPAVHRLARKLNWSGWVLNNDQGVILEVETAQSDGEAILESIKACLPTVARIENYHIQEIEPERIIGFSIANSEAKSPSATGRVPLIPDQAVCHECVDEMLDPQNRRYLYPFITCSVCGPRYSITKRLPFDRENTSMVAFPMCEDCLTEYRSPGDRRFHAQTISCPKCGPRLTLWEAQGGPLAAGADAIAQTVGALKQGRVIAVKSLGGFHLMVDATNEEAVATLRQRKGRETKPFAVMVEDLRVAEKLAFFSDTEQKLFQSAESPILLLRSSGEGLASNIAPGLKRLGLMRAYTPLHHLLLREVRRPLVATSGNLSDEPICYQNDEAFVRLTSVADLFLTHDRDIVVGQDDSIVRELAGRGTVLRLGRGHCPTAVDWTPGDSTERDETALAYGAHMKSSLALAIKGSDVIQVGPHLGTLETVVARDRFHQEIRRFPEFHDVKVTAAVCDLHPDYPSTWEADQSGLPVSRVQHHLAHVLSCMLDNQEYGPILGVAWDGSGYGADGTIWGGEFITLAPNGEWRRIGHLRTFLLPGGNQAVQEPRRAALGLFYEILGDTLFEEVPQCIQNQFTPIELNAFRKTLKTGLNAPRCSSVGRLFDGVAALLGVCERSQFEGQAAMLLEDLASGESDDRCSCDFRIAQRDGTFVLDWEPWLRTMFTQTQKGNGPEAIAADFHKALADGIVAMAERIGMPKIALTGGVFQNRRLTELTVTLLKKKGFIPLWHRQIPPNDGGIAAGQLLGRRIKCV